MECRFIQFAGIMFAMVVFAGCQKVNTVERAEPRANPTVVNDTRIITDQTLRNKARIVQLNEARVNDLLKIQAEIHNNTNSRKRFNYRFEWIDESGMLVDTPMSAWKQVSLAGQESTMISAIAPTPRAVDFKLKLVEASN